MQHPTDYVFLHGGAQGSWVWKETVAALAQQSNGRFGRAILLDIPGCGQKRGRDTRELGLVETVAELAGELEGQGLKDAVLVGHSQAGVVLPSLIAALPDMFRRVIYVTCCAPLPGQSVAEMMGGGQHGTNADEVGWPLDPAEHPILSQFQLMFCNDMSPAGQQSFFAQLGQDQWPERLGAERAWRYEVGDLTPASYVVCLKDGILPPPWQERFAQRHGASRITRIDAGHQVMNTRPHGLAEILLQEADAA